MKSSPVSPRRILWLIGAIALLGAAFAFWLGHTPAGQPDPRSAYSAFYVIFARDEILGLLLLAGFSLTATAFFCRSKSADEELSEAPISSMNNRLLVILIAAATFAITALGTHFVCHDYALSADEFMADFQARIFLRGEIAAEIPPQWRDAVRVIHPTYVDYLPATHSWKAAYLPVYAAMRAVFQSVYLESFLNPLLAAITLLALYGAIRRIWPNEKENALVAILLLAASAQFLLMAMTSYAMSAHLALNTIWLWLYLQPERRRFYLAPVVGVLAIGLHQPIVHALFVAPFLFRLLRERKWRAVSIFAVLYSLGCAAWYAWRVHYSGHPGPGTAEFFRLWNPKMLVIQPMDFWLVLSWSALATPLLVALGTRRIFRGRPIVQDAALSCLITFGFYYFFRLDQGHGWGYRYFHGTLSCFIIVAVAGWEELVVWRGRRTAWNFLQAGVLASLLVGLPLRSYQAESFIRPFARASEAIHSIPAEVVGIDPHAAWYSADLIRNDPFLEDRPVMVALIRLWPREVAVLAGQGTAQFVKKAQLQSYGLTTEINPDAWPDPFGLAFGN